jgi:hypothetical protein
VNARLHVSGGALGGGRMVEDSSSIAGVLPFASIFFPSLGGFRTYIISFFTGRGHDRWKAALHK